MSLKVLSAGVVIAGTLACTAASRAAVIAAYDFSSSLTAASTVAANANASALSRGSSTNAPISTNDFWLSKPVMSISRSNDTAAQVYLEATITAAPGFELNMDNFTFDGARGGAASPRTYEVHSSVAGLLNDASTAPTVTSLTSGAFATERGAAGSTNPLPTITADLSAAAYDHLSTLTMRVYFYTPTTNQNIDIDNVTFNGTVSPVPEPATLSAGTVFVAAALGRNRRRRQQGS